MARQAAADADLDGYGHSRVGFLGWFDGDTDALLLGARLTGQNRGICAISPVLFTAVHRQHTPGRA